MDYVEVNFEISPLNPWRDVLMSELAELEFESFVETDTGLQAYIQKDLFRETDVNSLPVISQPEPNISFNFKTIEAQNWNAVWESDFHPIEVNEVCRVRAPFHEAKNLPFEILISPKMSFGTGHHETTFLMMQALLRQDVAGKTVLDMGSGTGVLALLASRMNADSVLAVDVDDWAYENAIENVELNAAVNIRVEKGNVSNIEGLSFQVILANINKNVLLQDMPAYSRSLGEGGKLLISGFFELDVPDLVRKAESCGLVATNRTFKNHWACVELEKR